MASTIKLPARKGTFQFEPDVIQDIADTLAGEPRGTAVVVDEAQDTEGKAINRAQKAKAELEHPDWDFGKVKAHAVETDDGFVPAVSLPIGKPKAA